MKITISFAPVNKYYKTFEGVITYVLQNQEVRKNGGLKLVDIKVDEKTYEKAEIGKNITFDVTVSAFVSGNIATLSIKDVLLS